MVDAASRPPVTGHVRMKVSAPVGVVVEFDMRPSVHAIEMWTEPDKPGVCVMLHFEGGKMEFYFPTKVAKLFFRAFISLMSGMNSELREDLNQKARIAKKRMRRSGLITRM